MLFHFLMSKVLVVVITSWFLKYNRDCLICSVLSYMLESHPILTLTCIHSLLTRRTYNGYCGKEEWGGRNDNTIVLWVYIIFNFLCHHPFLSFLIPDHIIFGFLGTSLFFQYASLGRAHCWHVYLAHFVIKLN